MKTETFSFEKYDLPYESLDFDFDSIKKFVRQDVTNATEEKPTRKQSLESFQTETIKDTKSHHKSLENQKEGLEHLNYKELFSHFKNKGGHIRIKPWESYKVYRENNEGLIAALSNEDIDQVSTIYP